MDDLNFLNKIVARMLIGSKSENRSIIVIESLKVLLFSQSVGFDPRGASCPERAMRGHRPLRDKSHAH